jgi:hypothetical protein
MMKGRREKVRGDPVGNPTDHIIQSAADILGKLYK